MRSLDGTQSAPYRLLLRTCADLERRPVLLVDNLDLVFDRIDKSGRKRNNPDAPAYWALREQLSRSDAPLVIAGSMRLSEPFTSYDRAFYDYFLPRRLNPLDSGETRRVLDGLAVARKVPEVTERIAARPGRIEVLHELCGGNPRAVGLIFELLRQGGDSRAVEDFERLMDLTTPYYKARFEELAEQAQVVLHALAVRRGTDGSGLRFGHLAAELGEHAGLPTGSVSAQLEVLEREGLVQRLAGDGRTQYRISEQLFRLWLQMRGTRRVRQNIIGLAEFLGALFDGVELDAMRKQGGDAGALAEAKYAFALAETSGDAAWRRGLEARGAEQVLRHTRERDERLDQYLPAGDLDEEVRTLAALRERLAACDGGGLDAAEQEALLGSFDLRIEARSSAVLGLSTAETSQAELRRVRELLGSERRQLLRRGLHEDDLPLLHAQRARGYLPTPGLSPEDAEAAFAGTGAPTWRAAVWRLVGARRCVRFRDDEGARAWLRWARDCDASANSSEWANVAGALRISCRLEDAREALDRAFELGECSRAWSERARCVAAQGGDGQDIEAASLKAIELDPSDPMAWIHRGGVLADKLDRPEEAEAAYRKAIELDPTNPRAWNDLGNLLGGRLDRPEEAEAAYRKAIDLDPTQPWAWNNLGVVLADKLDRPEEAEAAYRKAIDLDPTHPSAWNDLGVVLDTRLDRPEEAEAAYRKTIEIDPSAAWAWNNLGRLLVTKLDRPEEARAAFRKVIEIDPSAAWAWNNLGRLFDTELDRPEEARAAFRKAIEIDPSAAWAWNNLGLLLRDKLDPPAEAEAAFRKAIELDPSHPWAWNDLGVVLADKLDRPEEAEAAYRKAIELDTSDADAWYGLGVVLADKLDRPEEAEAAYRKAIELDPTHPWVWSGLGVVLADKLDRPAEAEAAFRKAIDLDPTPFRAWNNLGVVLATRLDRPEEAEAAYRKAIDLAPLERLPRRNLALLLERQGRLDEASNLHLRAAELDPSPEPWWDQRRAALEARRFARAAAGWNGDPEVLRAALASLLERAGDPAAAVVSAHFVEVGVGPTLTGPHGRVVLGLLRDAGFDRLARPLLLAFEAAVFGEPDRIDDLEPELRGATRRLYERLTGQVPASTPGRPRPRRKSRKGDA